MKMNDDEKARLIGCKRAKGDNMVIAPYLPTGTRVSIQHHVINGVVIGHHEGLPIIQPETFLASPITRLVDYTDEDGNIKDL